MHDIQKIATQVFIYSSLVFGVLGILLVTFGLDGEGGSGVHILLMKGLMTTVFIILPSFALSVAGKYLNGSKE